MDATPIYIRVETMAANCPPTDAVKHLCRLADRIGIWVKSEIDGIEVFVAPGTNEHLMSEHFEEAVRRKACFVSTNVLPAGSGPDS